MNKPIVALWCVLASAVCAAAIAGTMLPLPAASSDALMQQLEHAHWIASGAASSRRVVYVFSDPDCPYCNDLWKAMKSARAADVQLRYLLVAVIDEESRGKDGAILEAKNPAAALEQNEREYARGGIPPKSKLRRSTQEVLFQNEKLMGRLKIFGTPGLVYRNARGAVEVFAGMPDPHQLEAIVGSR